MINKTFALAKLASQQNKAKARENKEKMQVKFSEIS